MIPFFNSYDNGFDWEENYWDLNILCEKQLIKHSRPFDGISKDYSYWYLYLWWWTDLYLEQIVQISVILTDTGCKICPKFVGVKRQNKIQQTYDHNCK